MIKEETKFQDSLIFEGIVSISSIIEAMDKKISDRKIKTIYFSNSKIKKNSKQLFFLQKKSTEYGYKIELVDDEFINNQTIGNSHGGIIAECTERTIKDYKELTPKKDGFYVVIDGIEDPYNFGYAIRSLYASGVDAIILNDRNWMSASGVVARASAGASELIDLYKGNTLDVITYLKNNNVKIISAGIRDSKSIYDADLSKPLLLVVGGEKRGISREILDISDTIVRIDYGRDIKYSLSAASAATVISYEIYRQNR